MAYAGVWSVFASAVGLRQPKLDDDEIKSDIKYALVLISQKKYQEAFDRLHTALATAQQRKEKNAQIYVLDVLANTYYQTEHYQEATDIFTDLLRQLMSDGVKRNDPAVIEISLKLADIYAKEGDFERAETGFDFCVEAAKANLKTAESDQAALSLKLKIRKELQDDYWNKSHFSDSFALYGMVLECYATYMIRRGRFDDAEECFKRCLELSHFVYGTSQGHSVNLLNTFGLLYLNAGKYEKAAELLRTALTRAVVLEEMAPDLADMRCNYAEALWHIGKQSEALGEARGAVDVARECGDSAQLSRVQRFLDELKADKKQHVL